MWEEVIIHAPPGVDLVCLSATVSNAEELADWIRTVRGRPSAVIEERRPVALHDLYLLGDKGSERLLLLPTLVDGRPNPEAIALDSKTLRHPGMRGRPRGRLFTPRRVEVLELLDEQDMLPAIYFIFSRAACDDAVAQCVREGKRLTTAEERRQIRAIAEEHVDALTDEDLAVLGLSGLADRAGGGLCRPPRRPGAAVQGGRGGLLRGRSGQGRVRHRDALARHQHAGPFGRHREAHQVHR